VLTTIQITKEEDHVISRLKKLFDMPSKKAVIMAGIKELLRQHQDRLRHDRLRRAVKAVQDESQTVLEEMSHLATALGKWDEN
jgi:hypothetical protein